MVKDCSDVAATIGSVLPALHVIEDVFGALVSILAFGYWAIRFYDLYKHRTPKT